MTPNDIPGSDLGPGKALGRHLTVDYFHCRPRAFLDVGEVTEMMEAAARKANATVITSSFHGFAPQGISGVVVISESHFTLHAWPEHDFAAVDIFTCSNRVDFKVAVTEMARAFGAKETRINTDRVRGDFPLGKGTAPVDIHGLAIPPESRGVSLDIDLYGCCPTTMTHGETRQTLARLIQDIPGLDRGRDRFDIFEREACFSRIHETGQIQVRMIPGTQTVLMDLYGTAPIDGRHVAESFLGFFKGNHYKLNLHHRG